MIIFVGFLLQCSGELYLYLFICILPQRPVVLTKFNEFNKNLKFTVDTLHDGVIHSFGLLY